MRLIRRLGATATAAALITAAAGFLPAHAQPGPTLTIGIDNATPAGHNYEFLDYYPRSGVNVFNHTVIDFKFNTGSPDGFHTATLGACLDDAGAPTTCPSGGATETAGQIQLNYPQVIPDNDAGSTAGDAAGQRLFSNKVFNPTNPPTAAGGCGDVATSPCSWDGSRELNSGALFSGSPNGLNGTEYFFEVNIDATVTQPITVNYFCAVHGPTMKGSFTVIPGPDGTPASTQDDLNFAAATQYATQPAQGLAAESAANAAAVTTNSNGSKTYALTAGTESPDGLVQVLEMLPKSVNIQAGDTVRWNSKSTNDPHTVTFPNGPLANPVDPFSAGICEDPVTGDGPATFGPTGPCGGNPNAFETHFNPQPQGATAIAAATTVGTSGIIEAADSGYGVGNNYPFTFPNAGTFAYACGIHNHMTGQVLAAAVVPPALPKAGSAFSQPPSAPVSGASGIGMAMVVLISLLTLIVGRGLMSLVRRRAG
jgi:plastocyanin